MKHSGAKAAAPALRPVPVGCGASARRLLGQVPSGKLPSQWAVRLFSEAIAGWGEVEGKWAGAELGGGGWPKGRDEDGAKPAPKPNASS